MDGKYQEGVNGEKGYSESKRTDGVYVNQSQQHATGGGNNQHFNSNLLWRYKFRTPGRTLSVAIQQHYSHYTNDKQTAAYTLLYDSVTHLPTADTVIQEQNIMNQTQVLADRRDRYDLGLYGKPVHYLVPAVENGVEQRL